MEINGCLVTVLGTVHFLPNNYELPAWVETLVESADVICFENNSDDINRLQAVKEDRSLLKGVLTSLNIPDPWMWISVYNDIDRKMNSLRGTTIDVGVDEKVMNLANKYRKTQVSLERYADHEKAYADSLRTSVAAGLRVIPKDCSMLSDLSIEDIKVIPESYSTQFERTVLDVVEMYINSESAEEYTAIPGNYVDDRDGLVSRDQYMAYEISELTKDISNKHILVVVGVFHTVGYHCINRILMNEYGAKRVDTAG